MAAITIGSLNIKINPDGSLTAAKATTPVTSKATTNANLSEVALAQVFTIKCTGLKPNTAHTFTFGGVDLTALSKQNGKKLGAGLTSDKNGKLTFKYHHAKSIVTLNITNVVAYEQAKSMFTAFKVAQVSSLDGSSLASFIVNSSLIQALGDWFTTQPVVG